MARGQPHSENGGAVPPGWKDRARTSDRWRMGAYGMLNPSDSTIRAASGSSLGQACRRTR
jgi:hypothetical protein